MKTTVTFKTFPEQKKYLHEAFGKGTEMFFKEDFSEKDFAAIIADTDIVMAWNPGQEGINKNMMPLGNVKFMQLLSAGYDHINLENYPSGIKIAANQGAYAEPMAEHVVAMMLALSKRLLVYHTQLIAGHFKQLESHTKFIKGSVLGIIGFGSIGKATAKLLKPFGVNVFAINSSGKTNEEVDFIGTINDLDYVLKNADTLLISTALNGATTGLINKRELELMKNDAVLINVARGSIINEQSLFEHLKNHPDFYAGIDAWWVKPFKYGKFELHYQFFELPNLLGSPHNSAIVENSLMIGTQQAVENVKRYINNEGVREIFN